MSSGAGSIQNSYLQFLQNQIDRTSNAYRRSAQGQYGFDDWFRDWTECAADVVGTAWGPWKDILDSQMRWKLSAKPGDTNVYKSFRCSVPEGVTLTTIAFASGNEAPIPFDAFVDSDRRHVIVAIPSVGAATSGTAYKGVIKESTKNNDLASVTLEIA